MKHIRLFLLLLGLFAPATSWPQPAYTQPEVDVLHYQFSLTLSDSSNQIQGEVTIRFNRQPQRDSVWFDLVGRSADTSRYGMRVKAVRLGENQSVPFTHRSNRVFVSLPKTNSGQQEITISYEGVPAKGLIISRNKFGERTFFGDNWPNNARYWLAVVDHPSDKATCAFRVTAPAHYRVIANGKLVAQQDLPDNRRLTHWHESVPIPTKVMVIGAARFAVEPVGQVDGIPVESWLFPNDSSRGVVDYRPAKDILAYFVEYIGPFPYEKLANVQSKTSFGGMENASCIFYNEKMIAGRQNLPIERVVAHEIAHQWFGDSATEADWSQIWLSEGFATYCSLLYLEHAYGRDTLNRYLNEDKGQIFRFVAQRPGSTVVQTSTRDLTALLNPNSYQKGGWVLHMLRYELGDDAFRRGIRAYYQRFRDGNARTSDFQAIMEQVAGRSLNQFFRQWLYEPAYPVVTWTWQYNPAKKAVVITAQQKPAVQGATARKPFALPLVFSFLDAAGREVFRSGRLRFSRSTQQFTIPVRQKPATIVPDPDNGVLMKISRL
ncbi:M1 family metallopeptidase [Nibrella viscosa]